MRWNALTLVALVLVSASSDANAGLGPAADHYLCYVVGRAKGQPKLAATGVTLIDRVGGAASFVATKSVALCNPADVNGSGIASPSIHQEGFALRAPRSAPKLGKPTVVATDAFATRTLVLSGRATLFDVSPTALGTTPPAPFASDPTVDASVNRFTCYAAKAAKDPKYAPPAAPTVADELFVGGRTLVVKKITRFCAAADRDGATPGAETRDSALVCYAVGLPPRTPKFAKTTLATNVAGFGAHVLVARKPTELCVAAVVQATPTPSPTATATPAAAKRVFATSTTQTGGFGGIVGADAICAARASAAALGGVFKAWVSTTDASPASTFTRASGPYRLVDGTKIADDWNDLVDGALDHVINLSESGGTVFGDVWTGTGTPGTVAAVTCNAWTTGSSGASGQCGSTQSTSGAWTASSVPLCNTPLRLYCFEQ